LGNFTLRVCFFFPAPVPDSTVCGLPGAFVVKVSWPLAAPLAVGEKHTCTVQFPPAGTVEPLQVSAVTLMHQLHFRCPRRRCLRSPRGSPWRRRYV